MSYGFSILGFFAMEINFEIHVGNLQKIIIYPILEKSRFLKWMCTCQWISGDFEEITKGEGLIYHQTFSFHTVKNLAMGFPTLCFDSILKLVVHQYTKMTHLMKTHQRTIIKMLLDPYCNVVLECRGVIEDIANGHKSACNPLRDDKIIMPCASCNIVGYFINIFKFGKIMTSL